MNPADFSILFPKAPVSRRRFLWAGGLGAGAALMHAGQANAEGTTATTKFEWKVVTHNERDYVSFKDVQSFYRFASYEKDGRHLWLRSPSLMLHVTAESDEMYLNNVKFCLSYPVLEQDGQMLISRMDLAKLLDPVVRPMYIGNPIIFDTVVIDAGHGGQDSGAKGIYGWEKDYALDTAQRLSKLLIAQGFKTKLTRSTDVYIPKDERFRIANSTPKSIFISIHYNSIGGRSASGIETYALSPSGTASTDQPNRTTDGQLLSGNTRDAENIALATAIHAMAIFKLKCLDRGIRRARWTVLTGLERAGILFEGGFVTNPDECAKINTGDYRDQLADSICGGVLNYRRALLKRGGANNSAAIK